MRRLVPTSLAAVLVACGGYDQSSFAEDFATSTCQLYSDCAILETFAGFEDVDACASTLRPSVSEGACPDYDRKQATACLDAINTVTCAQFIDGFWPSECAAVCPNGAAEVAPPTEGGEAPSGEDTGE